MPVMPPDRDDAGGTITLFLCGDVMTGRGIDQILPHPGDPLLHEHYVKSALRYVALAEQVNGPIPKPAGPAYIWGDALAELDRVRPEARIVNLETAVTGSADWMPKGINYRMHPDNVACLGAAAIDCCVLANNHVLDWGVCGLGDTLDTLRQAGIRTAGAGKNLAEARRPAIIDLGGRGRVLVYAFGDTSSGIPGAWAATGESPGVNLLPDLSRRTAAGIAAAIRRERRLGDIAVVSIHWGGNWGYGVPRAQRKFARALVDAGGADLIHGHSAHHPKGIEVYKEKLILYGCGDFLNDYEGIGGYEQFRGDLVLMYFATFDPVRRTLCGVTMTPMRVRNFRLDRAAAEEAEWLCNRMDREAKRFGAAVRQTPDGRFILD